LASAAGLDQFGVNLTTLKPGATSALRHWHEKEDELVYILQGEVVLIEDGGETVLKPGDAAGFKANVPHGHHLVNKSGRDAVFLEIGTRSKHQRAEYPDVDLLGQGAPARPASSRDFEKRNRPVSGRSDKCH
jgi:uncharacterized cupin superfamily protein